MTTGLCCTLLLSCWRTNHGRLHKSLKILTWNKGLWTCSSERLLLQQHVYLNCLNWSSAWTNILWSSSSVLRWDLPPVARCTAHFAPSPELGRSEWPGPSGDGWEQRCPSGLTQRPVGHALLGVLGLPHWNCEAESTESKHPGGDSLLVSDQDMGWHVTGWNCSWI